MEPTYTDDCFCHSNPECHNEQRGTASRPRRDANFSTTYRAAYVDHSKRKPGPQSLEQRQVYTIPGHITVRELDEMKAVRDRRAAADARMFQPQCQHFLSPMDTYEERFSRNIPMTSTYQEYFRNPKETQALEATGGECAPRSGTRAEEFPPWNPSHYGYKRELNRELSRMKNPPILIDRFSDASPYNISPNNIFPYNISPHNILPNSIPPYSYAFRR